MLSKSTNFFSLSFPSSGTYHGHLSEFFSTSYVRFCKRHRMKICHPLWNFNLFCQGFSRRAIVRRHGPADRFYGELRLPWLATANEMYPSRQRRSLFIEPNFFYQLSYAILELTKLTLKERYLQSTNHSARLLHKPFENDLWGFCKA